MEKKRNIIETIIEGLSGKAALRKENTVLSDDLLKAWNEQGQLQQRIETLLTERAAERKQWESQLVEALQLRDLATQQCAVFQSQLEEIAVQYDYESEENPRLVGEVAALREDLRKMFEQVQAGDEKNSVTSRDLVSLQQRHNEVVEEYAALKEQVAHSFPSVERHKIYEQMRLSYNGTVDRLFKVQKQYSAAMALLAELYDARQKHGSVKAWDFRYINLKAQYDQLAPIEAVEAKENINAE